jgi:hypothetical protein
MVSHFSSETYSLDPKMVAGQSRSEAIS